MANYLDKTGLITVIEKLKTWAENNFASQDYVDKKIPNTSNFLNKTSTAINVLKGRIQIGSASDNIPNAILHIRNVGTNSITGASVNGACYSVNADGTATLQHKTYDNNGNNAKNAAILRMSNQGLQFAVNTGNSSSPTEEMYKNIATVDYVDSKIPSDDHIIDLINSALALLNESPTPTAQAALNTEEEEDNGDTED